jgi:twinkle protein
MSDLNAKAIVAARLSLPDVDFEAWMAKRDQAISRIRGAGEFADDLDNEFYGETIHKGLYLPWAKVADKWRIRHGELTIWSGYNGHRKSMLAGQVLLHLMQQGELACVLSFEMMPAKTLGRMARQAVGSGKPSPEYLKKFLRFCDGKLWIYDQQGSATPELAYAVITYCAEVMGIRQFLVDSMMKVIEDEDDYNGQKRFTGRLQDIARELTKNGHPTHIHLVTHAKKTGDETKRPGKQDNKGSGAVVDQTDNFAVMFRLPEKKEDSEGADHMIFLDKQRNAADGFEGAIALWFDENTLQFHESQWERSKPRVYV